MNVMFQEDFKLPPLTIQPNIPPPSAQSKSTVRILSSGLLYLKFFSDLCPFSLAFHSNFFCFRLSFSQCFTFMMFHFHNGSCSFRPAAPQPDPSRAAAIPFQSHRLLAPDGQSPQNEAEVGAEFPRILTNLIEFSDCYNENPWSLIKFFL